jgi:hypothetical protein
VRRLACAYDTPVAARLTRAAPHTPATARVFTNAAGAEVTGDIGDLDPLFAIQNALKGGHDDEIIVSTLPLGVSR